MPSRGVPGWLVLAAVSAAPAAFSGVALAQGRGDGGRPASLSVQQAIEYGLQHSPQLEAARREYRAAGQDVEFARRERTPRLDAVFSGRYEDIPRGILAMADMTAFPRDRILGHGIFKLDAVFQVPLYTGGRIPANIRRAEVERDIADDFVARAADNLAYGVKRTYLTVLQQDEIIGSTQESIKALTESQRVMREFREVGKIPSLDLYRVDSQLADVTARLATEEAQRRTLLADLRALLGWPDDEGPALSDELTYTPRDIDLPAEQRRALETNPAYAAAGKRVDKQRQMVRMAEAELKPQLDLSAYGGAASSEHGPPIDRWGMQLTASQLLFDGGRQKAGVRAERERMRKEEDLLQQTQLDLTAEVQTACNDAQDAAARVAALESSIREAREALRLEQLKYVNGKGLVNDVLLAQAKLLDVQVAYAHAARDYGVALAALDRAVGRTVPPQVEGAASQTPEAGPQ